MTMHLCGPALTTTSTKKRPEKITKAKQEEFERGWRDRNCRLKEMHFPKETFEQYMEFVYGHGKKEKRKASNRQGHAAPSFSKISSQSRGDSDLYPNYFKGPTSTREMGKDIPSLGEWVTGPCSSKPPPTYTGMNIIGIAQMAKSNAVPVFSKDEVIDIARMRR